jgi:hypothetical protein
MPKLEDVISIDVPLRRARTIVGPDHIDVDVVPKFRETLEMSWAVLDLATSAVTEFDAAGGHFKSVPGHRYIVFIRVADVKGVQRITLDGSGMFRCATDPDSNGVSYEAALPLRVSIPHQEFGNTGTAPTLQDLIVVMQPDIGAFDYSKLSAGFHHFNGTPKTLEYFAFSGVMTFLATAANSLGHRMESSLTTSP